MGLVRLPPHPPLTEGWLAALEPPRLSPRVHAAIAGLVTRRMFGLDYERADAIEAAYEACEDELSRFAALADVGFAMLARDRSVEERRQACIWLTLFPSEEMVDALARVLLDDGEPDPVRDQAAWSLGFRQVQERHESLVWPAAAIARADDAIVEAWARGLDAKLGELRPASRHVDDARLFAWWRDHLDRAWASIEAFADAPLARALLARLDEAPGEDVHRAIRLAAHVLGSEAADPLLDYARRAAYAPADEARLAAIGAGSTAALEAFDAEVAKMAFPEAARARRAAWLSSGGASFHVRALRVARTTATLEPAVRRAACASACDDFALLARVDAIRETYLHAMWRRVAFGARHDAARVVACVEASPGALDLSPALAEPYVLALCETGRFRDAARVAAERGLAARATWEIARRGRPFAALTIAHAVRAPSAWSAAGEALASFLVGRPDLADAALETFSPDAHARWSAEHDGDVIARAVIDRDVATLAAQCTPAPPEADADEVDLDTIAATERRLRPSLDGRCVFFAGFTDRAALRDARARVEALGARVVDAPFGKVDLVVVPDGRPDTAVDARLLARSVVVVPLSRLLRNRL